MSLRRPLEGFLTTSFGTYWVSYLLRLDSSIPGDAFWSPDGVYDIGGGGFQTGTTLRLVNGESTDVSIERDKTYMLVFKVEPSSTSLWVNPIFVESIEDQPSVTRNEPARDGTNACFGFNSLNNGAYTLDELRIGDSYEAVTPYVVADPPAPGRGDCYESFGAGSFGFPDESSWNTDSLDATFSMVAGLQYTDSYGNVLDTQGTALSVSNIGGSINLQRELHGRLGSSWTYWVSYLLRLDSTHSGDAFWTPDGLWDIGASGLQGSVALRLVNGDVTGVTVIPGQTYFLVLEVSPSSTSLWVNPDFFPSPRSQPFVTRNEAAKDGDKAIFKFNAINNGAYTVDELRIGGSFESVTPFTIAQSPI